MAQAGGLGDVVFGLSRELELRGNAVEIVLPKYDCLRYDRIYGLTVAYEDLWVPWYSGAIHCTVWFGFVDGRKCFFIEPHSNDYFFDRGHLYGSSDDVERFAFFSKAALEFLLQVRQASGDRPLPRLADGAGTGAAVRDLPANRTWETSGSASRCTTSGTRGSRTSRSCGPPGLRSGALLPSRAVAGRLQPRGIEPAQRRNRLFELRHDGLAEACLGGLYSDQGRGLGHTLLVHRHKFGVSSTASTTRYGILRSIR